MLAVAAATMGFVGTATAQPPAPQPLSPTELNAWPDIPPAKPADPKRDEPLLPPPGVPVGTPGWSATPAGTPVPQPGATGAPAGTPGWMVIPQSLLRPVEPGNRRPSTLHASRHGQAGL